MTLDTERGPRETRRVMSATLNRERRRERPRRYQQNTRNLTGDPPPESIRPIPTLVRHLVGFAQDMLHRLILPYLLAGIDHVPGLVVQFPNVPTPQSGGNKPRIAVSAAPHGAPSAPKLNRAYYLLILFPTFSEISTPTPLNLH